MSSAPLAPSGGSQKSWWSKDENKGQVVGLVVLAAGAAGIMVYTWAQILPWLIDMVTGTIHLAELTAILAGGIFVLTNWRTRLIFRLVMRKLTSWVVTIDPIGILKEHLVDIKKKRDLMNEQITSVRGAIGTLESTIAKNKQVGIQSMGLAEEAKKRAASSTDDEQKLRFQAQMRLKANAAGRLQQSNANYEQLLVKTRALYSLLTKWETNVDYFIDDTEDQIKQAETQANVINKADSAFRTAMSIFKGNSNEDQTYDMAMEYLADQASTKLGEMEDFQRVAANFMDTIDLQNGVAGDAALAALDKYEQKVLNPASTDTQFLLPGAPVQTKVAAAGGASAPGKAEDSDYNGFFK